MEINTSDLIASLALLVSTFSAYYSKTQSDAARNGNRNDYRAHLAEQHEKYSALLQDVQDKHRADYSVVSKLAGETLNHIIHSFDEYDIDRRSSRPLRHLIHESSEMLYYAFKGQLAWQYGLNICGRIGRITSLEDRLEPGDDLFDGEGDHRRLFEQRYYNDPNAYQELSLLHDRYFCDLVEQLRSRVDSEKRIGLLKEVISSITALRAQLKALRPAFADSAKRIERAMDHNLHEQFNLQESPRLKQQLDYEMRRLDTLSELWLMDIDDEDLSKYYNYVSVCIYFCTVLHVLHDVHSWGWDAPHR